MHSLHSHRYFAFATVGGCLGIVDADTCRVRQRWTYSEPEERMDADMSAGDEGKVGVITLSMNQGIDDRS